MAERQPFRTAVLILVWSWLLILVLLPNLLVIAASFTTRDAQDFLSLPLTLESYQRLLNPLYLQVFIHSLYMASVTTVCLGVVAGR